MNLSNRLQAVVDLIDKNHSVCDIGTDHGYIPIYLIKEGITNKVIASDINKGPLEIAKKNLTENKIISDVELRHGPGLEPINKGEVDVAIISGMGGNLIWEIIKDSLDKAKEFKYLILQPAQHQEVLRRYLYDNGFKVIDETVVYDANKYYHNIKVTYGQDEAYKENVHYYTGRYTLNIPNEDFRGFINKKINSIEKILSTTNVSTNKNRVDELKNLLNDFRKVRDSYEV
ncbi:MAG: class I SAM-dependent methyltransferase [Clostridium sp.]|uniref:tRNA (adenine(22)-N(1))-methyltransferase n=1 Tax=Clostridium sp. TaxID=1506 RepID=UPI002FC9D8BF